jgi:magnesium chelatase family protein
MVILSANLDGFRAQKVTVEVDLSPGLHSFKIVGLPDQAVEEARERVSAAVRSSNAKPPQHHNRRITINLAPADVKKHGTWFDLPIALAFLFASGQLRCAEEERNLLAVGELGLDGTIRPVTGVLAAAILAKEIGATLILPKENLTEAMLIPEVLLLPAETLKDLVTLLEKGEGILVGNGVAPDLPEEASDFDLGFVRGQEQAKRALEIAAAGNHNLLMIGPPGAGKTLLARTMPTILPPLSHEEMIEVTTIWSVAGLLHPERPLVTTPPFRSPHHSASRAAIIGGGSGRATPGEVTLAHRGVLFFDELPEFPRHVLEALRQPMEDGIVTVSRSEGAATYPARFLFVAAKNPCPCGNATDPERECTCSAGEIARYERRVSGPILDRIDLTVDVPRVSFAKLRGGENVESSEVVRERVMRARARQRERFRDLPLRTNAEMGTQHLERFVTLDRKSEELLHLAHDRFRLSPRALTRILKVARTIADLAGEEAVSSAHVAEAIRYRFEAPEG